MIDTEATFILKRDSDNNWKIESISPLKDFSTVITGQAAELVQALNGEDISDDGPDGYDDNDYDYNVEENLLW